MGGMAVLTISIAIALRYTTWSDPVAVIKRDLLYAGIGIAVVFAFLAVNVRIPRDADQRSELMSITIPK